MRTRGAPLLAAFAIAAATLMTAPVTGIAPAQVARAASPYVDPHFRESTIFSGLVNPTTVRFAADGRVFVAEKRGTVKAFDSIADPTSTTVIDLQSEVHNFWDRGMLGMILDPAFLTGRPYLYLYYVYDAPPGETSPTWGDACPYLDTNQVPIGPGSTIDGCVVTSKLVRYTVDLTTNVASAASRKELIHDWCSQYPSHSGGGMAFGNDGQLYLSGGDGASFTFSDYGQGGGTVPDTANPYTPINPCGDPMVVTPHGGNAPTVDVATAEGGSLRSQDLLTSDDPTTLDGSLIRVDPDTGNASANNPLIGSADENARRIVAYGLRNPFRLTKQPGTGDIYLGDVGNVRWEEVNRFVPGSATVKNYGWPCYEGGVDNSYQPKTFTGVPWETLGNNLCDNLYAQGLGAVQSPVYAYFHAGANHACGVSGGSNASISGLAFYEASAADETPYPARYNHALFFVDYSRNCLVVLRPNANGVPDSTTWEVVASGIGHPVDLVTGSHGDLYYPDFDGGRVVRIRYAPSPVAKATVEPLVSKAPTNVTLDASGSLDPDPEGSLVAWDWDLDHDGVFGEPSDTSGETVHWQVDNPAIYPVTLRVTSSNGLSDTLELSVDASNTPPVPSIDTPAASLHWSVGDTIQFSGSASDVEDGALPASALEWQVILQHCVGATCHEHLLNTFDGQASGSFAAPDHPYPSHLELRLTATDSHGTAVTTSLELQPATTTLDVKSSPSGVQIAVGTTEDPTPSQATLIRGGTISLAAPSVWTQGASRYRFGAWDDGLGRTHDVKVTNPATRTATYVPDAPDTCPTARTVAADGWVSERASGSGDVDWFQFTLPGTRRVVITLGDLPVNAAIDLYSGCSTRLQSADQAGTRFERLTRSLPRGTYRVRVRVPSGAGSLSPYALRVLVVSHRVAIESVSVRSGGGSVRLAGQVVNGTGATVGRVGLTATFRDAQGRVVGRLSGSTFANRLRDGAVSPFVLTGPVPAYVTVSYALTPAAPGPSATLTLRSLQLTKHAGGTVTETGRVRNDGRSRARSVAAARAWYGRRGEVLNVGVASTTPSSLGPGASATFTIIRRSDLGTVQTAATFLRGR